jgi:hypothetical protein
LLYSFHPVVSLFFACCLSFLHFVVFFFFVLLPFFPLPIGAFFVYHFLILLNKKSKEIQQIQAKVLKTHEKIILLKFRAKGQCFSFVGCEKRGEWIRAVWSVEIFSWADRS